MTLRLLVPAPDEPEDVGSYVWIRGRPWTLATFARTDAGLAQPAYLCISYSWGVAKTTHPFDGDATMSSRVPTVLDAVLRVRQPAAVWIDALCIPTREPERSRCLSAMGRVYAEAAEVMVVLSEGGGEALRQIQHSGQVAIEALLPLVEDEWGQRVWTYHELVSNGKVTFIAERAEAAVEVEDVFRATTTATNEFQAARGLDSFQMRILYPSLDRYLTLLLDWKMAGYLERTAYQVMTSTATREATRVDDYFYALLGAISAPGESLAADSTAHPAELFMRACESKGDYSFMYTTAPRSIEAGAGWRPVPAERFPPVLAWPTYGSGQAGVAHATHLELRGVLRMVPGPLGSDARTRIERWLERWAWATAAGPPSGALPERVLAALRSAGFVGCGEHLELPGGYLYPYAAIERTIVPVVLIASGLNMEFGAPALIVAAELGTTHSWQGVGVFIGAVAKGEDVVCVS